MKLAYSLSFQISMIDVDRAYVWEKWKEERHTHLVITRNSFIMLSPQLRPLRELILRTRSVHLALQSYDFSPEFVLLAHLRGMWVWDFAVECP